MCLLPQELGVGNRTWIATTNYVQMWKPSITKSHLRLQFGWANLSPTQTMRRIGHILLQTRPALGWQIPPYSIHRTHLGVAVLKYEYVEKHGTSNSTIYNKKREFNMQRVGVTYVKCEETVEEEPKGLQRTGNLKEEIEAGLSHS